MCRFALRCQTLLPQLFFKDFVLYNCTNHNWSAKHLIKGECCILKSIINVFMSRNTYQREHIANGRRKIENGLQVTEPTRASNK